MFPRSQTLVFSTIIVLTRLIISRRIDSVACQTFWYTAQRFGGLSIMGPVGPHNIGQCHGPAPAECLGAKARVGFRQACRQDWWGGWSLRETRRTQETHAWISG